MKTLYIDCQMGAAGDMLMGALLELVPDRKKFLEKLNQAGIPGVRIEAQKSVKCGITGTHMEVLVNGEEEESLDLPSEENNGHSGHSHGHHSHFSMEDITGIIDGLHVDNKVKEDVKNIYQIIAKAESQVHGRPVSEVHFHEVGAMDAVADITGCAMLFHELGAVKIIVSPVTTGYGQVRCAHGILPVPAPATALILRGIPCQGGRIEGELCTPTGGALLKYFATEYGRMPQMIMEKIGYGMGKKEFEAANCIRAILGEA
ncbi:MAG TPA: LarC family nickel insertion protein [Candidatus Blautia stercoripullorum]|uniref:LarC family nickel insertion protein n=1 Tax=Candidatus Blautia stercoripullorum TaxID=2838502 RepID=A0A9D2R8I1_9FIRM|nr:LarC family nickel insertion protein [Candidatus Blautia stercoripullorum]